MPDVHPHAMQTRTRLPTATSPVPKSELRESDPRTWSFPTEPDFLSTLPPSVTSRMAPEDRTDKGLIAACAALASVNNRALCATEVGKVAGEMDWMKVNGGTPPNHVISTILRSHIKRTLISNTTPLLKAYNLMSSCSTWETLAMGISPESKPCQKRMLVWFLNSDFWGIQDPFERCWSEVREKVRKESGPQAVKSWEEKERQRKRSGYRVEWKARADGRVAFDDDLPNSVNHACDALNAAGPQRPKVEKRETRSRAVAMSSPTTAPSATVVSTNTPSAVSTSTSVSSDLAESPPASMREGIDGLGEALGRGKRKRKPTMAAQESYSSSPLIEVRNESKSLKIRLRVPSSSGQQSDTSSVSKGQGFVDSEFLSQVDDPSKRRKLSADDCMYTSREEVQGMGSAEVRRATLARLEFFDGELRVSEESDDDLFWNTTDLGFRPDDAVPPAAVHLNGGIGSPDIIVGLFSKHVPKSEEVEAQVKALEFDDDDDGYLSERDDLCELDLAGEDFDVDDLEWGEGEDIKIKKEADDGEMSEANQKDGEAMLASRTFMEDDVSGGSCCKLEKLDTLPPAADGDVPSSMVDDPIFLSFFGLTLKDVEHRDLSQLGIFQESFVGDEEDDEYEDSPSPMTGLSASTGRMTLGTPVDDEIAIKLEEEDSFESPQSGLSDYESYDSLSPESNMLSPPSGFADEEEELTAVEDLEDLDEVWKTDRDYLTLSSSLEPMNYLEDTFRAETRMLEASFPTTHTYVPICGEPFTPCLKEEQVGPLDLMDGIDIDEVKLDTIIHTETTTDTPLT